MAKPNVLFLCTHNAGRSQMATGLLRARATGRIDVFSGGSEPAPSINPVVIEAMSEKGIDISDGTPRAWTDDMLGAADIIVTMGCGDSCPVILGKTYLDWDLDDPSGKSIEQVREIRDEIERRVLGLMADLGWAFSPELDQTVASASRARSTSPPVL